MSEELTLAAAARGRAQGDAAWSGNGRPVVALEIIVPALNEESRIGETVRAWVAFLETQPFTSAVTVVDNGCTDRTADVVDTIRSSIVSVSVIGCARKGKGAAIRVGVLSTRARFVGFSDADLATPVTTLVPVMELLSSGHPVVIGSRRCAGAEYRVSQPVGRRLGGMAFRTISRSIAPEVADTQCGFKFFHAGVARSLFSRTKSNGFSFDVEIVGLALQDGISVTEIPVSWTDVHGSSFRPVADGLAAMRDLLALRARLTATA